MPGGSRVVKKLEKVPGGSRNFEKRPLRALFTPSISFPLKCTLTCIFATKNRKSWVNSEFGRGFLGTAGKMGRLKKTRAWGAKIFRKRSKKCSRGIENLCPIAHPLSHCLYVTVAKGQEFSPSGAYKQLASVWQTLGANNICCGLNMYFAIW